MIKMGIRLFGDNELRGLMIKLIGLGANFEVILRRLVPIIKRSINQNFVNGGRPDPWAPRWEGIESLFPNTEGKNVLRVSGLLRQSVVQSAEVVLTKDSLIYGTRLEYAKTQQFGGPSKIKVPENKIRYMQNGTPYVCLHGSNGWYAKKIDSDGTFTIKVRPRPFLMIQPDDYSAIRKVFESAYAQEYARMKTSMRGVTNWLRSPSGGPSPI
jgi:phage gpG-like protein